MNPLTKLHHWLRNQQSRWHMRLRLEALREQRKQADEDRKIFTNFPNADTVLARFDEYTAGLDERIEAIERRLKNER